MNLHLIYLIIAVAYVLLHCRGLWANALYDPGREAFLSGAIDADTDPIKAFLSDATDYTKNLATDDFIDDVAGAARVATSGNLAATTVVAGVFDSDDLTFSSVSGDGCDEIILWMDTTVEGTSPLICNLDTATGLPVTPNGGDINVAWANTTNRIFKL